MIEAFMKALTLVFYGIHSPLAMRETTQLGVLSPQCRVLTVVNYSLLLNTRKWLMILHVEWQGLQISAMTRARCGIQKDCTVDTECIKASYM